MLDRALRPEEFGLAGYVRAVAAVAGVPLRNATWETGDAPAAYLALDERTVRHPDRDLMLIWSARRGWKLCLENTFQAPSVVLARLPGHRVPSPAAVGEFVAAVLAGRHTDESSAPERAEGGSALAELLVPYAIASWGPIGYA